MQMTLRNRFVVLLAGFVVALGVLSALIAHVVFAGYARRIDEENMQETISRVVSYTQHLQKQIGGLAWDWGVWDETYDLIALSNLSAYAKANIAHDTFTALGVDILGILNKAGERVAAWQFDRGATRLVEPEGDLLGVLAKNVRTIMVSCHTQSVSGFVTVNSKLWAIGCAPVLPSSGVGSPLGVFVVGRRLEDQQSEELATIVHPSARFVARTDRGSDVVNEAADRADMMVRKVHLPGFHGFQGVDVSLVIPQQALAQSFVNAFYLPAWILLSGGALVLFTMVILERTVLAALRTSIASIRAGMQRMIGSKDETMLRRESLRRDEIGVVASSILEVLATLEESRRKLSESEMLYRTLIEFLPQGAVCMEADGKINAVNRSFLNAVSKTREEVIGKRLSEVWTIECARLIEKAVASSAQVGNLHYPQCEVNSGRENRWYEIIVTHIPLGSAEKTMFLILIGDITARIKAEREAEASRAEEERTARLAALGTLVAGVAHEVNNPNSVINLNMNVLQRRLGQLPSLADSERHELLAIVGEAAEASQRISSLITSLKTVARPSRLACQEMVNVNEVVRKAVSWLRADLLRKRIEIIWDLAQDLPLIRGSEKALGQVFVNIIQNACGAIENTDGEIRVKSWFEQKNGTVNVVVVDNGRGISPADMPHIFDPFFTTKRHEGGMGLGLSISAAILESHNGGIKVDSVLGRGTAVTIYLPVV